MLETYELLSNTSEVLGEQTTAHIRAKKLHVYPESTVRLDTELLHLRSLEDERGQV